MFNKQLLSTAIPISLATLVVISEIIDDLLLGGGSIDAFMVFEILVAALLVILLWREVAQRHKAEQSADEAKARSERLAGDLAQHIDQSFSQWKLSQAEHEIAWLLLKGFSFAEIAEIRQVKEKTLRQQATRIYAKGNISGRSELAATFMQDMLLSPEERAQQ